MAGKTSGAERDVRRILAEAGVAAIDDLRGEVATLEARLAEVERERDADRALVIVSKQKTTAADTQYWRTRYAAYTRYWRARCAAYALIGPTSATDGDSDAQGDR